MYNLLTKCRFFHSEKRIRWLIFWTLKSFKKLHSGHDLHSRNDYTRLGAKRGWKLSEINWLIHRPDLLRRLAFRERKRAEGRILNKGKKTEKSSAWNSRENLRIILGANQAKPAQEGVGYTGCEWDFHARFKKEKKVVPEIFFFLQSFLRVVTRFGTSAL
jgi:hypothetical protein